LTREEKQPVWLWWLSLKTVEQQDGLYTLAIVVSRLNPHWMAGAVYAGHAVIEKPGTGHRGF